MRLNDELQWWLDVCQTWPWRESKDESAPHSYVVRDKDVPSALFERAVRVIRGRGVPGNFYRRTIVYLRSGDTKWWTMGASLERTKIINRASTLRDYGPQVAPSTVPPLGTAVPDYDHLALDLTDPPRCLPIRSWITRHFGAMAPASLDVNCRTGNLLIDNTTSPRVTQLLEPSQAMLNEAVISHPTVKAVHPGTLTHHARTLPDTFDLVCALDGSASDLTVEEVGYAFSLTADLLLLVFSEKTPGFQAASALPGAQVSRVDDFDVVKVVV